MAKDGQLSPELTISAGNPPTLMVHNKDDHAYVAGSKIYHAALDQAHVPNRFLLYDTGGHGYALQSTPDKGVHVWPIDCATWLVGQGVIALPSPIPAR